MTKRTRLTIAFWLGTALATYGGGVIMLGFCLVLGACAGVIASAANGSLDE